MVSQAVNFEFLSEADKINPFFSFIELAGKKKGFPPATSTLLHSDTLELFYCSVYTECTWAGLS